MNQSIKQRKTAGKCHKRQCSNCKYCFLHPLLGVACGKEYPATYNDILISEDDSYECDRDYGY